MSMQRGEGFCLFHEFFQIAPCFNLWAFY